MSIIDQNDYTLLGHLIVDKVPSCATSAEVIDGQVVFTRKTKVDNVEITRSGWLEVVGDEVRSRPEDHAGVWLPGRQTGMTIAEAEAVSQGRTLLLDVFAENGDGK